MTTIMLHGVAVDLNYTPDTASRVARLAPLVEDNNRRVAEAALPFDSTPYAFPMWLATMDER